MKIPFGKAIRKAVTKRRSPCFVPFCRFKFYQVVIVCSVSQQYTLFYATVACLAIHGQIYENVKLIHKFDVYRRAA